MKVLVDTSIWSLAFRKKEKNEEENKIISLLEKLILNNSAYIIGNIRQEILSGISSEELFNKMKLALKSIYDIKIETNTYIQAASCYNICRKNGIQGSHIDFLICSVSIENKIPIFTLDKDFRLFSKYLKIKLF